MLFKKNKDLWLPREYEIVMDGNDGDYGLRAVAKKAYLKK